MYVHECLEIVHYNDYLMTFSIYLEENVINLIKGNLFFNVINETSERV